jgi:hypothetical protein
MDGAGAATALGGGGHIADRSAKYSESREGIALNLAVKRGRFTARHFFSVAFKAAGAARRSAQSRAWRRRRPAPRRRARASSIQYRGSYHGHLSTRSRRTSLRLGLCPNEEDSDSVNDPLCWCEEIAAPRSRRACACGSLARC